MKAGIYKRRDNGKHVYFGKDRSLRAYQLDDCHPFDGSLKASTSQAETVVKFKIPHPSSQGEDIEVIADRVADVPNGCTEPDLALMNYLKATAADEAIAADGETDFPFTSGGAWPGNFYSDNSPQDLDICIEFEDCGQDFLRWTLRMDDSGCYRVIDCHPYQRHVWAGIIVHNAENLVNGITDKANVSRSSRPSVEINYRVIATRMVSRPIKPPFETPQGRVTFPQMDKPASHARNSKMGAASFLAQTLNAAEAERRVYAQLVRLEKEGIVQLLQDEVVVLNETAFREAFGDTDPLFNMPPMKPGHKFRHCGKQSARKHRKQGHRVWFDTNANRYAWSLT